MNVKIKITAILMTALALALVATLPGAAAAARVSGIFVTYEGGQPTASRDLHFENCVTRDSYLAPTHTDGSFAQSLPPGCYDLRAERGVIVRPAIMVGNADLALGQVSDLAPFAPARLFDLEGLFPTLLTTPAPSAAYIFTHDATVVPSSAAVVPVPTSESEWLKLQKLTEGATRGTTSNIPAPEFTEPLDFGAQPHTAPPMSTAPYAAPPMPPARSAAPAMP
jgi:hypothetical protein